MKSNEIRTLFLNYFCKHQHKIVASSSLVPKDDPSLLFANAGMNQFKNVFLGHEASPAGGIKSVATAQKCVRAGGKHNDLENVGYTARHHTFFEMLGNFSFGEYFKPRAIYLAWYFLTEKLKIPKNKLYITVYENDQQAYDIWHNEIGINPDHLIKIGDNQGAAFASDNFWQMGETGPCGPCTEIFYDHGDLVSGGKPGSEDAEGDRFVEIWNIVFMQYNRTANGEMLLLDQPCIDTGMGLERIAAVMQSVTNNYDIDMFQTIIKAAAKLLQVTDTKASSLKVIADHIRSAVFLIADGILPANEGRGYVLRRIIRRALRHGHKLQATDSFFYKLVPSVIQEMATAYPELTTKQQLITDAIKQEEEKFSLTLVNGIKILEDSLAKLTDKSIPGELVFTLYDTYGFPVDITKDIACERGYTIDMPEFEQCLQKQRKLARSSSKFSSQEVTNIQSKNTEFIGYNSLNNTNNIIELIQDNKPVEQLKEGDSGVIILATTPFYAESGGQVGDTGFITIADSTAQVVDTQKQGNTFLHHVKIIKGCFKLHDQVTAEVDSKQRMATVCNHSATHLLHAALKKILGSHIQQKGSLVDPNRLRFDFSHNSAISTAQLQDIEDLINYQIRQNTKVTTDIMDYNKAIKSGAVALFDEKYTSEVRVLTMGVDKFSQELCGGTHVERTGDIGFFKIISEAGIASGIRRIEAITAEQYSLYQRQQQQLLNQLTSQLKTPLVKMPEKVATIIAKHKETEQQLASKIQELLNYQATSLTTEVIKIQDLQVLFATINDIDSKSLRIMIDILKQQLDNAVICLAVVSAKGISLATGVDNKLTSKLHAGKLLNVIAKSLDGKGGGRADFAQGAGSNTKDIQQAFDLGKQWLIDIYN